jgi:hypothetical protein
VPQGRDRTDFFRRNSRIFRPSARRSHKWGVVFFRRNSGRTKFSDVILDGTQWEITHKFAILTTHNLAVLGVFFCLMFIPVPAF